MKKRYWGIFFPFKCIQFIFLIVTFISSIETNAQCTNTSAWGSATAPTANVPVTISTCNYQTEYSTISSIVSGNTYQVSNSCGGYITVRSGSYNGTVISHGNSPHTFTATSSGTYYVHYNTNAGCGTATNCCTTTITCTSCSTPTPPANDLCSNATPLPCGTTNLAGTTVNTTNIANVSGCSMSNYGVWYTFVGDGQQTTITTNPAFDIKLSVSTGTCGSMTNIACTDAAPETATFTTVNGVTYYVYVAHWLAGSTTTGTFTISRTCSTAPTPPANDLCSNATALPCGTTNLAGTTVNTTNIANVSGCSMSNYGVWYTFVGDGQQTTITTNPAFDIKLSVSTGTCGSMTNIACTDAAPETATFTTVNGVTYYVYVAHWLAGSTTTGTFTISRTCTAAPPPLTNDNCATAINVAVNSNLICTSTTSGTTVGATQSQTGCLGTADDDVWYSFVATSTIHTVTVTPGTLSDAVLQVFSGPCGSLTSLACSDNTISGAESATISGLTIGNTYYFRVYSYSNGSGQGTFTACITTPVNPCSAITTITSCGLQINVNIAGGSGSFPNSACGWTTPGNEMIFSFTPATTGLYSLQQLSSFGTIDYQYKIASSACGSTGWTCISAVSGAAPAANINLTAGVEYLFLLDPESTTGGNVSFIINCPCIFGNGTGTTSLACPDVISGGLGLNGADPFPIDCNSTSSCVDIEAIYTPIAQTTSYSVTNIPYNPPYQFACLQNPVSVNIDDVWSPVVNLPFDFCFYGNNFNQCLIGSNGVLTFDLTNNTPGGYSTWSFNSNLPNNTLFMNTIFGVYHDIDPSKGGSVGYELITLNTGCRALVVSWHKVPMFSSTCNSILYSGMMVLYENTNVIEIYIQEKNVCSSWNSGNAIVGLQNGNGTQAIVAPGRNGLDADWTVVNEAWRFTPTGAPLTTVTWFEGSGTSGPVVGNTDVINVCPTSTTVYTAQVTYQLCTGNTLIETAETTVTVLGDKTWNGSIDTDWNKPNNWTPAGIPYLTDCVIIPVTPNDPIISGTNYHGMAGTLTIYNGATLTVNSNNMITVTDWVNVNTGGTFIINNNSSLVQVNNVTNTGNIIYRRNTNIRRLDYVYWSSPVAGFNVNNISSPIAPGPIYTWHPTVANPNGGQGNWQAAGGSTMLPGRGYIVRGPNSFTDTPSTLFGSFTGVPNNGPYTVPISRGSIQTSFTGTNGTLITNLSDNNNLLGNPYPSAIRASQFLFDNRTKIVGNVKLWTHGNLPAIISSPFYDTYAYNYSPGDYLTYNFTGTSCCPTMGADLFIGAGQGFFIQMLDGPAASDVISFGNHLRSATYDNSLFYRHANQETNVEQLIPSEKSRFWLDIINAQNVSERTLIGYVEGATMDIDNFFDSSIAITNDLSVFSIIDDLKLNIQGRALPFNSSDEVPIGFHAPSAGNYSIAIAAVDGFFNDQSILLEDLYLNSVHDLKQSPYTFQTVSGTFIDRFKIIYETSSTLSNPTFSIENIIRVITNENVVVSSSIENIESIQVFNVLGQMIHQSRNINSKLVELSQLQRNNTTLLLKIKLTDGTTSIEKVIY